MPTIPRSVAEVPSFTKAAQEVFTPAEVEELVAYLAANPEAGKAIPAAPGVRYIRFAAKGHGKGRGARIVYLLIGEDRPIYLIECYFKGKKEGFDREDSRRYKAIADAIRAEYSQPTRRK